MKRIYAILLVACSLSIGSCELESNARYTGNHYSSNTPVENKTVEQPKTQEQPKESTAIKTMNASGRSSARVNQ